MQSALKKIKILLVENVPENQIYELRHHYNTSKEIKHKIVQTEKKKYLLPKEHNNSNNGYTHY